MSKQTDLDAAYALSSKDDVKQLYARWAHSYDAGFGDAQGYQLPRAVAQAFVAAGGQGPLLDVGAGTGLVAAHLSHLQIGPIDALDLSDEMLAVARIKGDYRQLIAADVTQSIGVTTAYNGVISAGTFTLGHVGPEALQNLLDVAHADAVFAISVNVAHFEQTGFDKALAQYGGQIKQLEMNDVRIYDDRADKDHRNDLARIVTFKKT